MTDTLKALITAYNNEEEGLLINESIENYVSKILNRAAIVSYTIKGQMAGVIAYYNNDPLKENAFLSLLLVDKKFRGRSIGKLLMNLSLQDLENNGFTYYSLEVLKTNSNAIAMYTNLGFEIQGDTHKYWLMKKKFQ